MGQVRHGSTTTTYAVRAAKQRSQALLAQFSQEPGINPKTVAKCRKRSTVENMKTGPTEPRSAFLSEARKLRSSRFGATRISAARDDQQPLEAVERDGGLRPDHRGPRVQGFREQVPHDRRERACAIGPGMPAQISENARTVSSLRVKAGAKGASGAGKVDGTPYSIHPRSQWTTAEVLPDRGRD